MIESVYLHAPFCARRCFYCDFAIDVRRDPDPRPWFEAIGRELECHAAADRMPAAPLRTVFVGGGTPSLLGPTAMQGVVDALGPERFDSDTVFAAEANPESFTPEVARGWARAGLRRVSIGVQSFQESVLSWMGRLHGPRGARSAVATARDAGIDDISVDLIFALPDHLDRDWRSDLEEVLRLEVPHVSLYGLTIEPGTGLARAVEEGRTRPAADEAYAEAFHLAHELLSREGYGHYEVSNFARPGRESRHNKVYWSQREYLGLGNSAHSYVGGERFWNHRSWEAYRTALADGAEWIEGRERPTGEAALLERIWLGLRTREGLGPEWVDTPEADALRASWLARGWVREEAGLRPTVEGWLLLDELAVAGVEALGRTQGATAIGR